MNTLGNDSWQLISPFAPASYGYGKGTVVLNAKGKPQGFILLSYSLW
jgi:hypothetical protein